VKPKAPDVTPASIATPPPPPPQLQPPRTNPSILLELNSVVGMEITEKVQGPKKSGELYDPFKQKPILAVLGFMDSVLDKMRTDEESILRRWLISAGCQGNDQALA
jgi:hypothetical protein